MEKLSSKRFLLLVPKDMEIYKCIEDELSSFGFVVHTIFGFSERLLSKKDKKINSILKFFSNKAKQKRLKRLHKNHDNKNLDSFFNQPSFNQGLVIRPDMFSNFLLADLSIHVKKLVAYQWDGMKRYSEVSSKIGYFDKFLVFDKSDVDNYPGTKHTYNFYFSSILYRFKNSVKKYDVYYLGSYDARINDVLLLCSKLQSLGLKLNIKIPCSKKNAKKLKNYNFIDTSKKKYSYLENLKMASEASVILDFGHKKIHDGLSFRSFEAIGLKNKLISTNIRTRDLKLQQLYYVDTNLPINTDALSSFLKKSITNQGLSNLQYSFKTWLRDLF